MVLSSEAQGMGIVVLKRIMALVVVSMDTVEGMRITVGKVVKQHMV